MCAYLGGLVFGGSEEAEAVRRELDIVDLVIELVGLDVLQLFTGLRIVSALVHRARIKKSIPWGRTG